MKLMLNGKEVSGMGHYVMAGDIKDATAEDSNVLSGKTYYNNNGKREGTMPNRGGMSAELAAGGSVSIPEGYHNGEGVVRAQDLASQTEGTAAAANIEAGYTAWVNGEMVEGVGTMSKPPEKVAESSMWLQYSNINSVTVEIPNKCLFVFYVNEGLETQKGFALVSDGVVIDINDSDISGLGLTMSISGNVATFKNRGSTSRTLYYKLYSL